MNITMRQLQVFQAVARHLSYTRAAAALHLSQPAVSMQIRQLEDHLGVILFEQFGKRIHLTAAGQELLPYCRDITRQLSEIDELCGALRGLSHGTLRLAVPDTANALAARLLAAFCAAHPGINVNLAIANRKGLLERLASNETDLVIMGRPPDDMDLDSERFLDNPLVVIAPPAHPLAGRRRIPLTELLAAAFVLREPGSGTRIAMERFLGEHRVKLQTRLELASNDAVKHAVAAGLGLGIVSLHTLELELALHRVVVLDVADFPIMRYWYLVHRRGKRLALVAAAFRRFVSSEASRLWTPPAAG